MRLLRRAACSACAAADAPVVAANAPSPVRPSSTTTTAAMTRREGRRSERAQLWPQQLLWLVLLLLCVASASLAARASPSSSSSFSFCPNSTSVDGDRPRGNVVNVAALIFAPRRPHPLSELVEWGGDSPLRRFHGASSADRKVLRAWALWTESMTPPNASMPSLTMRDGATLRINVSYFAVASYGSMRDSDEFSENNQNSTAKRLLDELANPEGRYGRFHFLLPPYGHTTVGILSGLACERSRSCMVVGTSFTEARQHICGDPLGRQPMQADCVARARRVGERRFDYTVASSSNGDYWGSGSLALAVNQQVKRVIVFAEPWTTAIVQQLDSTMVRTHYVAASASDWSESQTNVVELTEQVRAADTDFVIFISAFNTTAMHSLVAHWRSIGYMPRVVAWLAGGIVYLPEELQPHMLIEVLWLPTLTGAAYRAVNSESNLELFPSNTTHDSPAVFADAYEARFGRVMPAKSGWFQQARAFHTTTIVQKLLELTQSDNIETLRVGSARIAAPGVFHAVQFDQWGRSLPYDHFVLQLMPDGTERVLTPLGLGQPPILPMPTWDERVFEPRFFEKTSERVMLAITCAGIVYILAWMAWGAIWWRHPVLRASAPSFLAVSMVGMIVMLLSNFFTTTHATDATCAMANWTFVIGFDCTFGALLLKNLRIWTLWANRSHSFAPVRMRLPQLFSALGALLLVDVALNIAWQLNGMRAERQYVDEHRPALDYMRCELSPLDDAFVWTHTGIKAVLLLSGVLLAWKLRKVATQFSESQYIALAIYNAALLLILISAMRMSDVGGYATGLLVRSYCICYLAVSTATIMLLPKLIALRTTEHKLAEVMAARAAAIALTAAPSSMPLSSVHPQPPVDGGAAGGGGGGAGGGMGLPMPFLHGHPGTGGFTPAAANAHQVALAAGFAAAGIDGGFRHQHYGLHVAVPLPKADHGSPTPAGGGDGSGGGAGGVRPDGAIDGSPDASPLPTLPFLHAAKRDASPQQLQQQQLQSRHGVAQRNEASADAAAAAAATAALRLDSEHQLVAGTTMLRATCSLLECVDDLLEADVQQLHQTLLRRAGRRSAAGAHPRRSSDVPTFALLPPSAHQLHHSYRPHELYTAHAHAQQQQAREHHPQQQQQQLASPPLHFASRLVQTAVGGGEPQPQEQAGRLSAAQAQPQAQGEPVAPQAKGLRPSTSIDALLPLQQIRRGPSPKLQSSVASPATLAAAAATAAAAASASTSPSQTILGSGGTRFVMPPQWAATSPHSGAHAAQPLAPDSTSGNSSTCGSSGASLHPSGLSLSPDDHRTGTPTGASRSVGTVQSERSGVPPSSVGATPLQPGHHSGVVSVHMPLD